MIVCYLTEYAQRFLTQILTRPDLTAGCQLWTLRQQGAKRQQRGPIQTQLPARLDRRREAGSGRQKRLEEERLFAARFGPTTHLKLNARSNTLRLQHIFLKNTGEEGKH